MDFSTGLTSVSGVEAGSALDLARGAIVGAFVIGAAFLAGFSIFNRSATAICGLLMVASAALLEFSWLGLFYAMSPEINVLLQGIFAASTIIFLSSAIRSSRHNAVLGGIMFAGALSIIGICIINLLDRVDTGGLMIWALAGVGGFALLLAASQALRRDAGARLVLPGILLVLTASILAKFFGGSDAGTGAGLATHVLFTIGVLAASLVAFTETRTLKISHAPVEAQPASLMSEESASETNDGLSESQLVQVLDYSGVAVWDWSPEATEQSNSLPSLFGADSGADFSPDAMLTFIHQDDVRRFEKQVLGVDGSGDGGFDIAVKLKDDTFLRVRGARAVDSAGELERLVAFAEKATGSEAAAHRLSDLVSDALDSGEVSAAFQPIVALNGGAIVGFEVLARWRDQTGDDVPPEEIVKAAESAGKGGLLANAMLDAAAALVAEKISTGRRRNLFAALNVSYSQICEKGFVAAVRKAVKDHDLPKGALVLELTESEAIADPVAAGEIFRLLKDAGAALAFDDFGAGFSSLSNLQKFDFDYLKIDKSFVSELEAGGGAVKIVRAMATLGKDLGLKVIAEGIETKQTAKAARDIGCVYGQGYVFGAPAGSAESLPEDDLTAEIETDESSAICDTTQNSSEENLKAEQASDVEEAPIEVVANTTDEMGDGPVDAEEEKPVTPTPVNPLIAAIENPPEDVELAEVAIIADGTTFGDETAIQNERHEAKQQKRHIWSGGDAR